MTPIARFAVDRLADRQAEVTERAAASAQGLQRELQRPAGAALAAMGTATILSALVRPHETFRFVGVLGLELTLLKRLLTSPQALLYDLDSTWTILSRSLASGASALSIATRRANISEKVRVSSTNENSSDLYAATATPPNGVAARKQQAAVSDTGVDPSSAAESIGGGRRPEVSSAASRE